MRKKQAGMPAKVRGLISNGNFNQLLTEAECNHVPRNSFYKLLPLCSCCGFDVTFNADLAANGDPMQDTLHMQAWEGMQQGSNLNPISNLTKKTLK